VTYFSLIHSLHTSLGSRGLLSNSRLGLYGGTKQPAREARWSV